MAIDKNTGYSCRDDVTAYISLGSNAEDACSRVREAIRVLTSYFDAVGMTDVFVTADIHMRSFRVPLLAPSSYVNAVMAMMVPRVPMRLASMSELSACLKQLEVELGRRPEHKLLGLVNIDFDLVVACGNIIRPVDFLRPYYFPFVLEIV